MSEYYTDDDVTAAAQALYDLDYIGGLSMTDYERTVEVVLAAVAPAIAARALREAADEVDLTFHAHSRREAVVGWLRARAEQVNP